MKTSVKKSLFLLEIVIAIGVVTIFSVGLLRNSLMYFYKERESLIALKFQWEDDLKKMDILSLQWNAEKSDKKQVTLEVSFASKKHLKRYDYLVEHDKKWGLVVLKQSLPGKNSSVKSYYFNGPPR